ncbi:MAG: hypothetical protein KKD13_02595 [Candidatus Margulisbacteria bacterium]|nr:hypothetical protein [Candidatus Margulisiibacteriota bacterium]
MAEQFINPIIPNIGPGGEAVAGNAGAVFTATDRKIIKERVGDEINPSRNFGEVFLDRGLTPKVENELTSVQPEENPKEIESRRKDHERMLKHAPIAVARDRVQITNLTPEEQLLEEPAEFNVPPEEKIPVVTADDQKREERKKHETLRKETSKIAKELFLNSTSLFDQFTIEQNELHGLVSRIKERHLKRLLCTSREEFEKLTGQIKAETLHSAKPEAREWIESQLNELTKSAADYKLKLLHSLQDMGFNPMRDKNIKWLEKIVNL